MTLQSPLKTVPHSPMLEHRSPYVDISVNGQILACHWTGCLYWHTQSTLIVSDLHLEKGSSFARSGRLIPPYDTRTTLARLSQCIAFWQPKQIISLGDSFHDPLAYQRLDDHDQKTLKSLMRARQWIWITGNHDPLPPSELGGISTDEFSLESLTFRHEPQPGKQPGQIAGHLHPAGKIIRRSKAVRRPCFASDGNRMILPSFGAYTGGLNIRSKAFAGIFEDEKLAAVMLGKGRVFHIPARALAI